MNCILIFLKLEMERLEKREKSEQGGNAIKSEPGPADHCFPIVLPSAQATGTAGATRVKEIF